MHRKFSAFWTVCEHLSTLRSSPICRDLDLSSAFERQRILSVSKMKSLFEVHRKKSDTSSSSNNSNNRTYSSSSSSKYSLTTRSQCQQQGPSQIAYNNTLNIHLSNGQTSSSTSTKSFVTLWHCSRDISSVDSLSIFSSFSRYIFFAYFVFVATFVALVYSQIV